MAAPWDRRSPAEQTRVQDLAAATWLPSILRFSGHWSALGASLNLTPEDVGVADDIDRFPTSRARDLLASAGAFGTGLILRPNEEQIKSVASTSTLLAIARALRRSGAEGLRRALLEEYKPVHVHQRDPGGLVIASSRRDLDRMHLAGARAAAVLGLTDEDYAVSAVAAGPSLEFWGSHHLALGSSMLALHPRGHGDDLDRVVASFALVSATVVLVEAHEALELASVLRRAKAPLSSLRTIVVLGPVPEDKDRTSIVEAFLAAGAAPDVAALALWGPGDGRSLYAEQRENPGALVTYPDLERLEVVDPLTGLATEGPGDLTISTIGWTGTSLLRYQTGTWVGGLDDAEDPVTGRTAPRLVGGQLVDAWSPLVAVAKGAPQRIDLRGVAATVAGRPGVRSWLFEMRPPTQRIPQDRLVLELGGDVAPAEVDAIERALPGALGSDAATIKVSVDPARIVGRVAEAGSHFIDLR